MEKTEAFLRMMEHPEEYTDGQLRAVLEDEECRQLYEAMRLSVSAYELADARERIARGLKDEEWQKFERSHTVPLQIERRWMKTGHGWIQPGRGWLKTAAMFAGVLLLAGAALAAVHLLRTTGGAVGNSPSLVQETRLPSPAGQSDCLPTDTLPAVRVFENTPLDSMITVMAGFYHKQPDIRNSRAHELRLYYRWDCRTALDSVVKDLNHFDQVSLSLEGDRLIVEP